MSILQSIVFTGKQLEHRLSTVSAGLTLTSIIFVILTSQVGLYFRKTPIHSRHDPPWIKGIVIFIWMMQALEFALACHITAVAHSNDSSLSMESLKECLWETAVYVATCATTECLVHAYFISRIYILETNRVCVRISMMLCIILVLEGSFGFTSMLFLATSGLEESKYVVLSWSFPVWLGFSILADISIAGSMCYILRKGNPFVSTRLNLLVKRLIKFCIQTGLITGLVTVITVALWTVTQLDLEHLLMSFPVGGIYATCFMANLIARESYFHQIHLDDDDTECIGMAMENIVFAAPGDFEKNKSTFSDVD